MRLLYIVIVLHSLIARLENLRWRVCGFRSLYIIAFTMLYR